MSGSNSSFWIDPNYVDTLAEEGNPAYTGVSLQTSAQAIPIPIMWGTRRMSPNLLWNAPVSTGYIQGTVHNVIDASTGANYQYGLAPFVPYLGKVRYFGTTGTGHNETDFGSDDTSNTASIWWLPVIFGLCEGPVNSVGRVWPGGGGAPSTYSFDGVPTSPGGNPDLLFELLPGTLSQTEWGFWAFAVDPGGGGPLYPGQNLAYKFTAGTAAALIECGGSR